MALLKDVLVGERWAYRISDADRLTEVVVQGVNDSKPARVEITYAAIPESVVDSVPPSRLKVRWPERDRFLRREAQWRTISSRPSNVERMAVTAVIDEFFRPAAAIGAGKLMKGTIAIYDADLVDVFMGGGLEGVLRGADHVAEGAADHYGWEVAVEIAKRTCRFKPDRVMALVQAEEKSGWSAWSGAWTGSSATRAFEASTGQTWSLLRNWCGRESDALVELTGLRDDLARLIAAFEAAVVLVARGLDEARARELFTTAYPEAEDAEWHLLLRRARGVAE
ncbi:hypothetical protein [Microcella humidisoli]|uniref:Uncharacterized protein n=1 Tax=Microcella humidisoli TaxID=2963406 RepID=A0ABY5G0K5_9MICO|nr:hypothetical protein [Microcella humidisoli]UTT63677.1 hypothetical protein NNL39_06170 [Microcella humidisoli]